MSNIKTLKHEMEYDTSTKRAIFNGRNKTRLAPTQDPFPERLLSTKESSIDNNTIDVGTLDVIENHTLEMSSGSIEGHTLIL